ncbi:MAG: helix-turn-helix transcriptional regulator [Clostridia bacterium]|nr:helix-turn-helix transcriptional regulator [Clostridia bacterium]
MLKLKELRKERGLTNQQMADFLGVSKGSYNYYELGKTEPSIDTLKKLADFFCVSIDYLVGSSTKNFIGTSLLTDDEKNVLKFYRGINDSDRNTVYRMLESFYQQEKNK